MMTRLFLLVSAIVLATCLSHPIFDENLDEVWETFKTHHQKEYSGIAEESARRLIFEDNVAFIHKHNLEADLGKHSHRVGINEFADMTTDEYTMYLKGFRSSYNKTSNNPVFLAPENADVPDEVDWRKQGYVTPVKNQERCGSCWAFSATGSLEGQHFKKTGKLVSLSEQNLVDCATKEGNRGCHGGAMDLAFRYIKMNGGLDTEESYPYTAKEGMCHFDKSTIGATDAGYMDIRHGDEEALMRAVAAVGPISVAMDASQKDLQLYKSGVYTSHTCSSTKLDHGVLVVGFGTEMSEDYWLVKNSWGESWGEMGYLKIRRNYHNMCGIATQASYPLV